jgi:hypothetical protein
MALGREISADHSKGLQLQTLIERDRARLEARLGAGVLDGLDADLALLWEDSAKTASSRQLQKAATSGQLDAAERLLAVVMAVRTALKLGKVDAVVLTRVGVGKKLDARIVRTVLEGARLVVEAYAEHPDVLRRAGVLPGDIAELEALSARLAAVDTAQEGSKVTSKQKTAARDAAHRRVKDAIAAIVGAAELAFVYDPERLALYRALLPKRIRARKASTPKE